MMLASQAIDSFIDRQLERLHRRMTPSSSRQVLLNKILRFLRSHHLSVHIVGSYATGSAIRDHSSVDGIVLLPPSAEAMLPTLLAHFATEQPSVRWYQEGNRFTIATGTKPEMQLHLYVVPSEQQTVPLHLPDHKLVRGQPLALVRQFADFPHIHKTALLHLLKVWRYLKSIRLPSLYVDAMVFETLQDADPEASLSQLVQQAIERCIRYQLRPIQFTSVAEDPVEVSLDSNERSIVLRKFQTIQRRFAQIQRVQTEGDSERSFQLWNLIFTGALSR